MQHSNIHSNLWIVQQNLNKSFQSLLKKAIAIILFFVIFSNLQKDKQLFNDGICIHLNLFLSQPKMI